ncbi:hypothetical protein NFC81_00235 [Salinispirillum sp. LH 10-3-1]|uniref:Uncharacterized protein n=1 Tax=Salinispirillum sp. LH 10-3-1 TaxID=2952525 RepID=A0AB38YFX8_9GAMM
MKTDYIFRFNDRSPLTISVQQNDQGLISGVLPESKDSLSPVTALAHCQCAHCPLQADEHPYCPLAATICPALAEFGQLTSYEETRVLVVTEERSYLKRTSLQQGLRSLLGLLMGGSGCPYMLYFRPLARFHLPFSSDAETVFRSLGNFLIAQHLHNRRHSGDQPGSSKTLERIYADVHQVNAGMSRRLRSMASSDAINNALVLLDLFTGLMNTYLEEETDTLEHLYAEFIAQQQ